MSSNGFLHFAGPDHADLGQRQQRSTCFQRNVRIAPLWDNLDDRVGTARRRTSSSTARSPTRSPSAGAREWRRHRQRGELLRDPVPERHLPLRLRLRQPGPDAHGGRLRRQRLHLRAGSSYNGQGRSRRRANSLLWTPTPGLTYYDIGAYEFQGDSGDATPPYVTSVLNAPGEQRHDGAGFLERPGRLQRVAGRHQRAQPANYSLVEAGVDNAFDTGDDVRIALKPAYSFPETNLTLELLNGVLPDGDYRLTLSGSLGDLRHRGQSARRQWRRRRRRRLRPLLHHRPHFQPGSGRDRPGGDGRRGRHAGGHAVGDRCRRRPVDLHPAGCAGTRHAVPARPRHPPGHVHA